MTGQSGTARQHVLQELVFPEVGERQEIDLYFHVAKPNTMQQTHVLLEISSHTYFNSLAIDKWRGYADVEKVGLRLEGKGEGFVRILAQEDTGNYHTLFEGKANLDEGFDTPELDLSGVRGLVFFEFVTPPITSLTGLDDLISAMIPITKGYYWTSPPPKREVSLSVVVTTFKREKYIRRLLDTYAREGLATIDGAHKVALRIIDNGNTLAGDDWVPAPGVEIIPNPNTGGAGGFSRGMVESLEDAATTHILLMDDDVLVPPESIRRTVRLLARVKDNDTVMGGAMLDQRYRWRMHEQGARIRRRGFQALKHGLDLRDPGVLMLATEEERVDYYGWWYFVMSRHVCETVGLAIPIFFRGDDMNYAIRIRRHGFTSWVDLNGVCVWHENFLYKENPVQMYYDMRNQFLINPALTRKRAPGGLRAMLAFIGYVMPVLRGHRYVRTGHILRAVDDFFRGPEFLETSDSGALHRELMADKTENIAVLPVDAFDSHWYEKSGRQRVGPLTRLTAKLAFSGILWPDFLRRQAPSEQFDASQINASVTYHPLQIGTDMKGLAKNLRARRIVYIERHTRMGYMVEVSSRRGMKLLAGVAVRAVRLFFGYGAMARRYRAAANDIVRRNLWERFWNPEH